jgi:leader peptidase (prepilin peptidase) / N-methyltransferase
VGTVEGVGICVATGIGAGVIGWWFRASGLARRWAEDARTLAPHFNSRPAPASLVSPVAIWPAFTSVAAAAAAAASLFGRMGPLWTVPFLGVWACGLAMLALVDRETLLLPHKLVHLCGSAIVGLLLASSAVTGDWGYIERGLLCAVVAAAAFGAWALLRPRSLGLGDARMACLVAVGAGALSPAGCLVALTCAPFLAACTSALRRRRERVARTKPIALGPFLALAGVVAVLARAV